MEDAHPKAIHKKDPVEWLSGYCCHLLFPSFSSTNENQKEWDNKKRRPNSITEFVIKYFQTKGKRVWQSSSSSRAFLRKERDGIRLFQPIGEVETRSRRRRQLARHLVFAPLLLLLLLLLLSSPMQILEFEDIFQLKWILSAVRSLHFHSIQTLKTHTHAFRCWTNQVPPPGNRRRPMAVRPARPSHAGAFRVVDGRWRRRPEYESLWRYRSVRTCLFIRYPERIVRMTAGAASVFYRGIFWIDFIPKLLIDCGIIEAKLCVCVSCFEWDLAHGMVTSSLTVLTVAMGVLNMWVALVQKSNLKHSSASSDVIIFILLAKPNESKSKKNTRKSISTYSWRLYLVVRSALRLQHPFFSFYF